MDYKKLDSMIRFTFRDDLKKIVKSKSYSFISEAVINEYKKTKSLDKTADAFGKTQFCIHRWLKVWGIERRPQGGDTTDSRYSRLDSLITFQYPEELYDIIDKLGYKYVSKAVISEYNKNNDLKHLAKLFNRSHVCIYRWLDKWGTLKYQKYSVKRLQKNRS